jgi:predicted PurR-regulated permease PerM
MLHVIVGVIGLGFILGALGMVLADIVITVSKQLKK